MQTTACKTISIDASEKILGRLASKIALLLQGKNQPSYRPNLDCGCVVVVKNVSKIKLSGQKQYTKEYKHFSGYPGGLKRVKFQDLFGKNPEKVLRLAVWRMLPKNRMRNLMIKRLKFV